MTTDENYLVVGQRDSDGEFQEWVLCDFAEQWCSAYRIRQIRGEPTVVEMRVLPGSVADYKDAVSRQKEPGSPLGEIPAGGLGSRVIRQLKPDEARREALRAWRRLADLSGDRAGEVLGRRGYSLAMIVTGRPDSKPGRRGRSDLFYAEIGDAHAAMIERGSRKPNVELAELLASSWEKPVAAEQVRDWLHAARSRRIVRRKPGPTWGLTEKGERVLNETKGSEK